MTSTIDEPEDDPRADVIGGIELEEMLAAIELVGVGGLELELDWELVVVVVDSAPPAPPPPPPPPPMGGTTGTPPITGIAIGATGTYGFPLASTVVEKVSDEMDVCVDSLLLQVLLALVSVGFEPVLDPGLDDVPAEVLSEVVETLVPVEDATEVIVDVGGALELKLELNEEELSELLVWDVKDEDAREVLLLDEEAVLEPDDVELLLEVLLELEDFLLELFELEDVEDDLDDVVLRCVVVELVNNRVENVLGPVELKDGGGVTVGSRGPV
ncbi:hypothetical protein BDP55DRAFT_730404 [Colletotrichum godetiae]|uniref:Uncharacterized protein n=1 Tax=Colletotrichum godetiae TaxID=1209918 RepID=A0AAJ0AGR7_9PEZI|nr:uncharacterized protein BDP55DRAFT_730404 [Colletotrichum godetiae]KAK1673605.1 hypothetical protein BDP55DRAFT_730404 [Colletotrichum godetiae]